MKVSRLHAEIREPFLAKTRGKSEMSKAAGKLKRRELEGGEKSP